MSFDALLDWAMRHHHPYLCLSDGQVVHAGIDGWFTFLAHHTEEDMLALVERVQRWQSMERDLMEVTL